MASESIGSIYPTQIPGYADNADIQAAFRLYHYGSTAYSTANTNTANLVNPSIAYTLNNLQTQITTINTQILSIVDLTFIHTVQINKLIELHNPTIQMAIITSSRNV